MNTIHAQRINRLPAYMFGEIVAAMKKARQQGIDVIDLGMGNPDQPTPPHIVDKLTEVARDPKAHRYSVVKGIPQLRKAIGRWYGRRFGVGIDPDTEAVSVIGTKEGLSHLAWALLDQSDVAMVPNPTYPVHLYSIVLAGGNLVSMPLLPENDFIPDLESALLNTWPRAKMLILSFPHNPTAATVEPEFFKDVVKFAKKHKLVVVHDFAYADIVFDGYRAPSFLETPGARDVGVEFVSLSKSYNMAGWRIGFAAGNRKIVDALVKMKSYTDYGLFAPVQVAGITALDSPDGIAREVSGVYRGRRDVLVDGLNRIGWAVERPRATMYVWAPIPPAYRRLGSMKFALKLLAEAEVTVSPGIGFGTYGDGYVRIALVENEKRIRQAVRNIGRMFKKDGKVHPPADAARKKKK